MSRSCLMTLTIQPRRLSLRLSILRAEAATKQHVSFRLERCCFGIKVQTDRICLRRRRSSLGDGLSATWKKEESPPKPLLIHPTPPHYSSPFRVFFLCCSRRDGGAIVYHPPYLCLQNWILLQPLSTKSAGGFLASGLFWSVVQETTRLKTCCFSLILELLKVLLSNFTEQCLRKSLNMYLKLSKPAGILTVIQPPPSSRSGNPQLTRFQTADL